MVQTRQAMMTRKRPYPLSRSGRRCIRRRSFGLFCLFDIISTPSRWSAQDDKHGDGDSDFFDSGVSRLPSRSRGRMPTPSWPFQRARTGKSRQVWGTRCADTALDGRNARMIPECNLIPKARLYAPRLCCFFFSMMQRSATERTENNGADGEY
jgi:hypothetical protein